jgi:tetratricopeptide (TPR) repeat protein
LRQAAEHQHRALNIFERLGDSRQTLSTFNNLSLIYCEAREFARAVNYGNRVLAIAGKTTVEPYLLSSVLLNIGVAHFWQERYGEAIEHYRRGLDVAMRADLKVHINRAHYNLAEAYYKRFRVVGSLEDEKMGDEHAAAAMKAAPMESDPGHLEATKNLKAEILGPDEGFVHDRLQSEEVSAHFSEMMEIKRHRAVLAVPGPAEAHARAHLEIAKAYLAISAKERHAARELIDRHSLEAGFVSDFEQMREAFGREVSPERQLAAEWRHATQELLSEERRAALLDRLLAAGSVSKSSYAELCGVALATASKHLGLLAERGLLLQTGRGPRTRYVLPCAAPGRI